MKKSYIFLIVAILALSIFSFARVPTPEVRIKNFGRINENYYRGAQPKGEDYVSLARLGIKTVVDLQKGGSSSERRLVEAEGMKFFCIEMTTTEMPKMEQAEAFLKIISDPDNLPVYVHCKGGRHRTGVMTAVYRITHDGWSADQAFAEMKRYEFEKSLFVNHNKLKSFVYNYHAILAQSKMK